MQNVERKKDWVLNPNAFRKFLEWLDEGVDSEGQKYLEMHNRLISYFDRKNCLNPNELADETLNRVVRRLEEEGNIEAETPAKYCYITARFVFMEYLRTAKKEGISLDEMLLKNPNKIFTSESDDDKEENEKMLVCLEECTKKLDAENRDLIIHYYFGEENIKIENRKLLAEKFGITKNALSIRAYRIREKLEMCVGKCVEKQ